MKQLYCPHYGSISGLIEYCMKGRFPINCETCDCEDKHYIEVTMQANTGNYSEPQSKAYTITHNEMLALYDRERAELMKLSKEELIEKIIGKREEVGMSFI